ncbi:MAG: calcium/sodium antiporter [Campylobacterales bacterium]|nr:calcium/sodium antiporter [Campylobacterales bacterium]
MDIIIFIAAMASLIYGADFVIDESERIALHFDIPHFVIGATLVAFGTSLPEMAASVIASAQGKSEMALANVVGSNFMNIALILGIVFLFSRRLEPERDLFANDSAWVLIPPLLFGLMIFDGRIGRFDALLLLSMMAAYLFFLFGGSKSVIEYDEVMQRARFNWLKSVVLLLAGFALTIGGAHFVVESGSNIARLFGVSEWMIGIVLIAFGTSLPELVVSVAAIRKGNADMSIGNIIGSNVANLSMVLGSAALVAPLHVNLVSSAFDLALMGAAALCLTLILANRLYHRAGGVLLLILLGLLIQNSLATL